MTPLVVYSTLCLAGLAASSPLSIRPVAVSETLVVPANASSTEIAKGADARTTAHFAISGHTTATGHAIRSSAHVSSRTSDAATSGEPTYVASAIVSSKTSGAGTTVTSTDVAGGITSTDASSTASDAVSSISGDLTTSTSAAAETTTPDDPAWCENVDLANAEAVAAVWNDEGVGAWMDEQIAEIGEERWVVTLANQTFPGEGDTRAFGCSQLGQDCFNEGLDCKALSAKSSGEAFWVFTAVKNMQKAVGIAETNLLFEGLTSTLKVRSIVDDFALPADPNPQLGVFAYLAASFTIVGGVYAFANPGTRMFAGMAGGGSIIGFRKSQTVPNTIDATSLDSTLETALKACREGLREYLALAVGAGGNDYASLPNQGGEFASPVANLFHDGQYLLQAHPEEMFSESFTWLTRALIGVGMKGVGYAVIGEKDVTQFMCEQKKIGLWFPDVAGGRCFRLYVPETRYGYGKEKWRLVSDDIVDKLDSYGIGLRDFYQAAYDCAVNGKGPPDPENLPKDGAVPLCFYSVPSYEGWEVMESIDDPNWMDSGDWPRSE